MDPSDLNAERSSDDRCPQCGHEVGNAWLVCAWCGQQLAAAAELAEGARLSDGRYQILRVIGRGGFGITYDVGDRRLQRRVAMKELFPDSAVRHGSLVLTPPAGRAAFREARERFLREARVLARFTHPGIVRVYEVFEEHGTAYLVMELLEGRTLVQLLQQRNRPFPESEVLDVAGRVAAALRPVHSAGVLHRDINPSNVMMTHHGRIVVIDFGLARDYDQNQTVGMTRVVTPGYAPLEQYRGEGRFGPSTDVYGLAATCYRLATSKVPVSAVERDGGAALPSPHKLNPAISRAVSDAILDGLELEPGHRPQDLDALLARLGIRGIPDGPRSRLLDTVPPPPETPISETEGAPFDPSVSVPVEALGSSPDPPAPTPIPLTPTPQSLRPPLGHEDHAPASLSATPGNTSVGGLNPADTPSSDEPVTGPTEIVARAHPPVPAEEPATDVAGVIARPAGPGLPVPTHAGTGLAPRFDPQAASPSTDDGRRFTPSQEPSFGDRTHRDRTGDRRPVAGDHTQVDGATRVDDPTGLGSVPRVDGASGAGGASRPGSDGFRTSVARPLMNQFVPPPPPAPERIRGGPAAPRVPGVVGPHRAGRHKLLFPLTAVALATASAAPVLVTTVLVFVVLPLIATLGDSQAHRLRTEHGVSAGWAERRMAPGALATPRFVRNAMVSTLRATPMIGVGAVLLAAWYGLDRITEVATVVDLALRAIGLLVVGIILVTARDGSGRFRTGLGLDDLVARWVPDGRTTERLVVLWIGATFVIAGSLWLTPDPFPLP